MTTETKRRAPTWDDVRAAYAEGLYTPPPGCDAPEDFDQMWEITRGADWHPDNPANHVTEPEWRTGAPEVGRWVEGRDGTRACVVDELEAFHWRDDALICARKYAWRYVDPPT